MTHERTTSLAKFAAVSAFAAVGCGYMLNKTAYASNRAPMADDQLFAALLALVPATICVAGVICAVLALISAKRNAYPSVAGMAVFGIATNVTLLSVSAYATLVLGFGVGR